MFLKYIRIQQTFINKKYNNSTPYFLRRDKFFASAEESHIVSYIDKDVRIHSPENYSNWVRRTEEAHHCMVLLLQQYGPVLVNVCNLES